jgi:hypothetical protein
MPNSAFSLAVGESGGFLPMSFGCFEIESHMTLVDFRVTMTRTAAIAHQHVAHERVQQQIDEREDHQDSNRRFYPKIARQRQRLPRLLSPLPDFKITHAYGQF